jgi:hypothetical protein
MKAFLHLAAFAFTACTMIRAADSNSAEVIQSTKLWDESPHSAFTDLIRFNEHWFCSFRTGTSHISMDGHLQVLSSKDGKTWTAAADIDDPGRDLRDPKLSITPDNQLMMVAASVIRDGGAPDLHSMAWFSSDGVTWSKPVTIGEEPFWLWRVTWHENKAYAVGYANVNGKEIARLYSSEDGKKFSTLVETFFDNGYPNESTIRFMPDGTALCLLRRDKNGNTARLGTARAPYTKWVWKDLGVRFGGPNFIRLPDGRLVAGGRLHNGKVRTALCWLDPKNGKLTEFLPLTSGGDSSYPGLVFYNGVLWVSYYSSHEGKTNIYLAQVRLPNT